MASPMQARAAGDASNSPIRLRCLAGDALPEELGRDSQRAARLNEGAVVAIAPLLRALVLDPMTPELGEHLSRLCVRHEVAEADLGHVVKVARWLLREASAADLSNAELEADARAIGLNPSSFRRSRPATTASRRCSGSASSTTRWSSTATSSSTSTGASILVSADRRAAKLVAPVAVVTLAYKSESGAGRLTLQLLPDQLARLEQLFGALAQRARPQDLG